jgi:hypothetical protein
MVNLVMYENSPRADFSMEVAFRRHIVVGMCDQREIPTK